MLAYNKMRTQVLSSTVPAHRMCQTLLIVLTFMDAALHTDKGSSALKYRACAQNVSDTTHIFYTLESCPTPRYGDKCSQVPCLRTECVRRYYSFFSFWDAGLHQDEGSSTLKHRACAQNVSHALKRYQSNRCPQLLGEVGRAPKIREEIRTCCLTDRQKVRQKVRRKSWMPNLAKEGFGTNRTKIPLGCFYTFGCWPTADEGSSASK
jgi:hypothetical protein